MPKLHLGYEACRSGGLWLTVWESLTLLGLMTCMYVPGKHLQNGQWCTCTSSLVFLKSAPFSIIFLGWHVLPHCRNTWNFFVAPLDLLFFFYALLQQCACYRLHIGSHVGAWRLVSVSSSVRLPLLASVKLMRFVRFLCLRNFLNNFFVIH